MVIGFDVIREIHRKERESRSLQKLPEGFFSEVREYLKAKESSKGSALDMIELENARLIVNDLIDRREHKIVEGAMVFVRSGILLDNMTEQEKNLFNNMVELLRNFREEMWAEIRGRKVEVSEEKPVQEQHEEQVEKHDYEPPELSGIYLALKDLATFIWSDGKRYSIKENDVVKLPDELAAFLEEKGIIKKAGD